jgi:RHS repeat-associated protein
LEPNFADDPDGKTDWANPYYFTGRRLDLFDDGNLAIQINRHRYYDYYTGRWLTHDPLGVRPGGAGETGFFVVLQYTYGANLYQYGGSNPVILIDPWGYGEYKTVEVVVPPPNTYQSAIDESKAVYDTWPRTWSNFPVRLDITNRTWATIAGGYAKGMNHAARHLKHFAWNRGTELDIGYPDLINEDLTARAHFDAELEDAINYVQLAMPFGESIVTIGDYSTEARSKDWLFAVGGYRTWAYADNIKCSNEGKIEMEWTIVFRDVYDWELGSPAIGGWVSDDEMACMHRWGEMQEYVMTGSYTVKVEVDACGDLSTAMITPVE